MSSHTPQQIRRASKFLSLLLRHRPETIGLTLDPQGWANIEDLIERANAHGDSFDRALIDAVVETNTKQRFSVSEDGTNIRANQGHSIDVDLEFVALVPPAELFHGTAVRFLEAILTEGLTKRSRQHVHMTDDQTTAVTVGSRHGKPVVLKIDAANLHSNGGEFFRSANGVWLVDTVPPTYLSVLE